MATMTRIIAGDLRGRRIDVPDQGTRPTSDRVREALFNVIVARTDLDDARVVDLYAGSGALGIEALSRGAGQATFVDSRKKATSVISANLTALGLRASVVTRAVDSFLAGSTTPYDLVFIDPPYDLSADEVDVVLARLVQGWLAPDALVVLERAGRSSSATWPELLEPVVDKNYGDTRVVVARFEPLPGGTEES